MGNEIVKSEGMDLVVQQVELANERERIRKKLSRLADKALDTFEEIMDNSEDDKARNVAASKVFDSWGVLNQVTPKVDLGGVNIGGSTTNNIQLNVGGLRDVLAQARRAMGRHVHVDDMIAIAELQEDVEYIQDEIVNLEKKEQKIIGRIG
jgi:hypothetical protein